MGRKGKLENNVDMALSEIANTIIISPPHCTPYHINYFINNLLNDEKQINNLCWVILGLVGKIFNRNQKIRTTIDAGLGTGEILVMNLSNALESAFLIRSNGKNRKKIINERDPLILELIAHVILLIQKEKPSLQFDNINPEYIRPPHSKVNEGGLDIIVLSNRNGQLIPLLGEVKSFKDDPKAGFIDACKMFRAINLGKHNTEIRDYFSNLNTPEETKQKLSSNFWTNQSNFSAFIGHDDSNGFANHYCSKSKHVKGIKCSNLFLISTPFRNMDTLFEEIISTLEKCLNELG